MAGLLDGLGSFGLGKLEDLDLYEKPEEKQSEEGRGIQAIREQDFLYDKTYNCPVCEKTIKARTVKIGRAKLVGSDMDLRPRYEGIDLLKYDIVMCPHCGFTALSRYFQITAMIQIKKIKETITPKFKAPVYENDIYSYDEAIERYKLALLNTIVKLAKTSERAYVCLKTAWVIRGKSENLDETALDYEEQKAKCEAEEMEFLKNALDGFIAARQAENFPICGMDEATLDYLIAVLATRFDQLDVATKLLSGILVSATNARMKDKARDLKDVLMQKIKERAAQKKNG